MGITHFIIIVYIFATNPFSSALEATETAMCPIGFDELGNTCRVKTQETTFPYHCPLRFTEYEFADRNLEPVWLNVHREAAGFFPAPILNPLYGHLLWPVSNMPSNDFEDCVIGNRESTANCDDKRRGLCVYHKNDRQFCEAYDKICNISQHNCHCQSKNILYLCQVMCEASNHNDCSSCDQKFSAYPEPEIQLTFNGIDTLRVDVIGPLKLILIAGYNVSIYCFSDVYEPDAVTIRGRYRELYPLDEETMTKWTYTFQAQTLAVGLSWCEGFTYESHRRVVSNRIMVNVRPAYGLTFVINTTANKFTLTPYTLHSETIWGLRSLLNNFNDKIQMIRLPEFPHLYNNRSSADLSYHLTTHPHVTNAEYEVKELSKLLLNCESIGLNKCSVALGDRCLSGVTSVGISLVASWPEAFLGQRITPREILLQENGLPITRQCLGRFMTGAYWSDVTGEISTRRGSSITEALYELLYSNQTAKELNEKLNYIISNAEDYIPLDVYLFAKILETIAQSQEEFSIDVFVDTMNIITEVDSEVLQLAQSELNATDIILYNFDIALGTLASNVTTTVVSRNILAQVVPLDITGGIRGIAIYHRKGEQMQMKILKNVTMVSDIDSDGLELAVFLPPELLEKIFAQTETPSLVSSIFLSDTLFRSKKSAGLSVSNAIVGIFVTDFVSLHFPEPISVTFAPSNTPGRKMFCGFWKFGFNNVLVAIHGHWQKEQVPKMYRRFKTCTFNHMTHFAILANAPRNQILDLVSLIGCAISTLGVVGIIITAIVFKTWRNCTATKILLNLSLTILIQMSLLFLFHVVNSKGWCTVLAITLHYIIISQFCWMFVIGYLQYRKFVQVLVKEPMHLLLCSSIFAWLTPTFPVLIIFFLDGSGYKNPPYCFLSGQNLYFGVFIPVGCIVVSNLTIFALIFASLSCTKTQAFGTKQNIFLLRAKLSFILFFLMGFSWIFGLLSYFSESLILSYMFCVTSSVQGFVLYIFFVVCNKRTRKFWVKNILCCRRTAYKSESPFITKSK